MYNSSFVFDLLYFSASEIAIRADSIALLVSPFIFSTCDLYLYTFEISEFDLFIAIFMAESISESAFLNIPFFA